MISNEKNFWQRQWLYVLYNEWIYFIHLGIWHHLQNQVPEAQAVTDTCFHGLYLDHIQLKGLSSVPPTSWLLVMWAWSRPRTMRDIHLPQVLCLPVTLRSSFSPWVLVPPTFLLLSPHMHLPWCLSFNLCPSPFYLLSPFFPTTSTFKRLDKRPQVRGWYGRGGERGKEPQSKQVYRALETSFSTLLGAILLWEDYSWFTLCAILAYGEVIQSHIYTHLLNILFYFFALCGLLLHWFSLLWQALGSYSCSVRGFLLWCFLLQSIGPVKLQHTGLVVLSCVESYCTRDWTHIPCTVAFFNHWPPGQSWYFILFSIMVSRDWI